MIEIISFEVNVSEYFKGLDILLSWILLIFIIIWIDINEKFIEYKYLFNKLWFFFILFWNIIN